MVIKADLKCKQTDFNLPQCQIEKVVKLTPSEYTEFVSNPLGYYDFLREFNAEKHEYSLTRRYTVPVAHRRRT